MTQAELKTFLLGIDPKLKKTFWAGDGSPYTVWDPHEIRTGMSDDMPEDQTVTVAIHRYTDTENDDVIQKITQGLTERKVAQEDLLSFYDVDAKTWHFVLEVYVSP